MSQKKRYLEQIGRILIDYKSFLTINAKASLYDNHKYSEYIFKQLLNLIYNWDLKHTEEKYSTNTSGIDLFSDKNEGYCIQITAQNEDKSKKVTKTITDYNDKWKLKYKFLKILFIQENVDNLKKHNTTDKLIEILSFKEILVDIKNLDDSHRVKKILDFLKQELGNELSYEKPLKGFKSFDEKMKGKIFFPTSNTEAFKNGLLFYTNYEESLIGKLSDIYTEKNKKALIEGPPCTGKTSLLFGLNSILEKKLIKCYYLNLEEWNQNYDDETIYFKGLDCLLIIDNAHIDRYEIAKRIYQVCNDNKINALFISRDNNTQKLLNSSLNRFDFDLLESFSSAFGKREQIEFKIKGIIENRVSYLRRIKPQNDWNVGNIEVVLQNSDLNLLKTFILLNYWEEKYSEKSLQYVDDIDCYKEFFNSHIYKKMDYEVVFKYSTIYKFECSFKLVDINDTIQQQIDNGIFIDTKSDTSYYRFPHSQYAELLSNSIKFERSIQDNTETSQILKYILEMKPKNIHILIEGLLSRKYYTHLDYILSDNDSSNFIFNHYSNRKDIIDIKLFLFGLNEIKREFINENSKKFVSRLIESLQDFNLVSFEKTGEEIIEKANEVADLYKIIKRPSYIRIDNNNRFKSKSFFELSELITKNRKNRPVVTKIALSLKYSEWKTKFQNYNGDYSKKIEGIANLNKEPITRQLAFDLYDLLDVNEAFRNLENSPIDVFGKVINNLSNFYNVDGRKKPKDLLRLFKEKRKFENQTKFGLSKYAIGLSHINQVDNDFIQDLYPGEDRIIELFSNASANDLAQRIPLFIKCFPNKKNNFISIIKTKLLEASFYSQKNNTVQGFTELAHIISTQKYPFTKEELKKLTFEISNNMSKDNSLTELSNATQVLGKKINEQQIHSLISPERISRELKSEVIKLTDLETILTKNLKEKIAVEIYTKIDTEILRKSCLRSDISFEQATKVFMQLSNREFNYDKEKIFSKKILQELFTLETMEFTKKIKSSNIQDFLTGYYRLYNIDSTLTEKYLLDLIKSKSLIEHKEVTISTASQSFRNIASLASNNMIYRKISEDFISNSYCLLIENSKGIDVGQISDGLNELSIEHSKFAENLLKDLIELIKLKSVNERNRNDFSTRIIPQLLNAAGKNLKLVNEINNL